MKVVYYPGQEISVEFHRTVRKCFLRNSLKEWDWYFCRFPQNFLTFPHISTHFHSTVKFMEICRKKKLYTEMYAVVRKSVGKKKLCMEMCGIVRKLVEKHLCTEMCGIYGNRWKKPTLCENQIWLRSGLS